MSLDYDKNHGDKKLDRRKLILSFRCVLLFEG